MVGKIPHYVNDPVINRLTAPENKLVRPRLGLLETVVVVLLFGLASLTLTFIIVAFRHRTMRVPFELFMRMFPIVTALLFVVFVRFVLIWSIRLYQRYAKSETRLRCRFVPSCSEYAVLAISKYGAVIGGVKTILRLLRCRSSGGVDFP